VQVGTLDGPCLATTTLVSMALDQRLLDILVCPEDKGELRYLEAESILYNPRLRRAYPITDGIPVLLIDEARTVDDAEHERLMGATG
jgi:uncharacterized protein YbaR (Trm112 family)